MIVTMSQEAPPISLPTSLKSGPKRPRLSLQTSPLQAVPAKSITALRADVDTTSPTAFNTLSNAYAAAIEQASPKVSSASVPWSARAKPDSARPTSLRLVTGTAAQGAPLYPSQRTQTPGPFSINYPDTPSTSCNPSSPAIITHPFVQAIGRSTTEYTPPQSAHPTDEATAKNFSFQPNHPSSPRTPRRRATTGSQHVKAPYTHPRSLRSILRNSPLPPRSTISPVSPSRSTQSFSERSGKKVGYNDPLTQTITTNKYTKSHIDLLAEEATASSSTSSPSSPLAPTSAAYSGNGFDIAMAYTGVETRDGGQTPGPFEEMRRRMAGLGDDEGSSSDGNCNGNAGNGESELGTPINRKRKREKKRRWVWTIGVNEDECDSDSETTSGATSAPHESIGVVNTTSVSTSAPAVAAAVELLPQLEILAPTVYVPPPSSKHVDRLLVPAAPTAPSTTTPAASETPHEAEMTRMIRSPLARPGSAHSI